MSVVNYAGGETGETAEEEKPNTEQRSEGTDGISLGVEAGQVADAMEENGTQLERAAKDLTEGNEIRPLSSGEVLSHIELRGDEEFQARENLGDDASLEQIQEYVFNARVESLNSNTITDGEREIIEADFIEGIGEETGINPELILDLRALGFEGAQDWDTSDIAENLEDMTQQLQSMKERIESEGGTFPETKEEFLALYEAMNQGDEGESNNREMDPESAAANGVDVQRTEDGFQIDPTTPGYAQVGDTVVGPPGAPYSRGGQVYTGTGEINTTVNANLDTSYSGLQENTVNPLSPDQEAQLQNPENKELIEKRVPAEWHGAAIKMSNKEGPLNPAYPIMLASMQEKRAVVCYPDGKVDTFPIIIGSGGYREGAHSGGKTTPTYDVFHFGMNSKVTGLGVDASNSGSSTVLGASIQSPEGLASGGKWWHGVADSRIPGGATWGCIGASQQNMMMAARSVLQTSGGYGFNTNTREG